MFERNRVDNIVQHTTTTVPAELTLDDGRQIKGKFLAPISKPFAEVLNGPAAFLEFEPYGGERAYIAKTAIQSVRLTGVPAAQSLDTRLREIDGFDPFAILGVPRGASFDDVRQAYHRLAKIYHPDRYANAELPDEVRDYLATMARRVNAAYAALEAPVQIVRKAAANQAEPIYTSRPRA
jgi:hypothetical protein